MDELKRRFDRMEQQLNERYARMEGQLEKYIELGSQRARDLEARIADLERRGEGRDERIKYLYQAVADLGKHLDRMENTLLKEFKISQDIMKSMLDHEWAIDKAKMDMKHEMERREADMKAQQEQLAIDLKRERSDMRRKLMLQFGMIGLPVLTALATALSYFIENLMK